MPKRKMPEMSYVVKDEVIEVILPIASQGKFRCKKRTDIQDFGVGLAPTKEIVPGDAYIEWQIGYDTIIGKDEKETRLNTDDCIFVGANEKRKHPYELSEIVYYMCKNGIITKDELDDVYNRISNIKDFLQDKYPIKSHKEDLVKINDISFLSSSTKMPTFITTVGGSQLAIEIMIQKQQYATGTQAMLYLVVPVIALDNAEEVINRTPKTRKPGVLSFGAASKELVFSLLICFGMCSASHNHDIKEIIKVIHRKAF